MVRKWYKTKWTDQSICYFFPCAGPLRNAKMPIKFKVCTMSTGSPRTLPSTLPFSACLNLESNERVWSDMGCATSPLVQGCRNEATAGQVCVPYERAEVTCRVCGCSTAKTRTYLITSTFSAWPDNLRKSGGYGIVSGECGLHLICHARTRFLMESRAGNGVYQLEICMCTLRNANHQLVLSVRAYELGGPWRISTVGRKSHFSLNLNAHCSDFHRGNYFRLWHAIGNVALDHDNSAITIGDSSEVAWSMPITRGPTVVGSGEGRLCTSGRLPRKSSKSVTSPRDTSSPKVAAHN